jgi:hypothetical protein
MWVGGCRTQRQIEDQLSMPWLRRLVAGLSPRGPGFDPRSVQVKFMMNRVALEQVCLTVLRKEIPVSFQQYCVLIRPSITEAM